MIARLLPAIKAHLERHVARLELVCPEKDERGNDTLRAPKVFIGDFPANREDPDEGEFPCILVRPHSGHADGGEETADVALILAVYNPEDGDGEGLEMDLALLTSKISGILRRCLDQPLEGRFTLVRDERGRTNSWQRGGDPGTSRPYAQLTMLTRWTAPGWE